MAESNLDLILRTKREGDAPKQAVQDLQEMKSGLSDLEKTMAGSRTTIGNLDRDISAFGTNLGSANDFLGAMGVNLPITPMAAFGSAVQLGTQYVKDSVNEYANYIDEIYKLSTYTGMATEETSKLYQVADDLRIPVNSLEMALKTMATNGTEPSIAGIMSLSDQYLAIQTPLERAQFLTDNFGRSGQEMAKMMNLGRDAIKETTDAVQDWMIVTGKSEEDMNTYKQTVDRWDESIMNVRYNIATQAMPILSDLMNYIMNVNDRVRENDSSWWNLLPTLDLVRNAWYAIQEAANSINFPDIPSYLGGWFSRAGGGPMEMGSSYKVGEREVEYITAMAPGYVTPASQGSGGNVTLVYSPTVSLASQFEAESILVPYIKAAMRKL